MNAKVSLAILALGALFSSSQVLAAHHGNYSGQTGKWRGLVGVELGYGWQDGDFNTNYTLPFPAVEAINAPAFAGTDVDSSRFLFGVLGGVEWVCSNWLVGLELNIDWRGNDDSESFAYTDNGSGTGTVFNSVVDYERGTVFGLTARTGFKVHEYFMPYIRLGAQYSHDELTFIATVPATPTGDISSESDGIWGFVAGIGFEVPVLDYSALRLEYNYVANQNFTIDDKVGPLMGSHSLNASNHNVKLAWVLQFS